MAFERLTRWLGPRVEPPPELASALEQLEALGECRPELTSPARSLGRVIAAAFLTGDEPVPTVPYRLPPEDRAGTAVPIFRDSPPPLSGGVLKARALAIVEALSEDIQGLKPVRDAIRGGAVDIRTWAVSVLAGRLDEVEQSARATGIDPDFAASLLRMTLLPSLSRLSDPCEISPRFAQGSACPRCGGTPLLGELRGLEREVRLRCGLCAGDWSGGRVVCPRCGEADHRRLETRHVEGEADRCRLLGCGTCGYRLKLVATFARLSAPGLVVADLATIHLDLIPDDEPTSTISVGPSPGP